MDYLGQHPIRTQKIHTTLQGISHHSIHKLIRHSSRSRRFRRILNSHTHHLLTASHRRPGKPPHTDIYTGSPNRQLRRRYGKTDATDAEAAARAALSGQATIQPKSGDGPVEGIRMLRVARRSAVKARTQAINQLHALVVTAPNQVKHQLGDLPAKTLVKVCAAYRPSTDHTTITYAKKTLRLLARRYQALTTEIQELDTEMHRLCVQANPALLAAPGVGADTASALLITAGDNPQRMRTEASFAALCGASPVQASSGRTIRHRLNRGGNRQANNALWRIASVRMRYHPTTIAYVQKRQTEGKTRREIIRCLKRHIAREIRHLLTQPTANTQRSPPPHTTPKSPDHPHPRRPSAPNLPHPPLTTRTRHPTQPPPRHPIPTLAHPPPKTTPHPRHLKHGGLEYRGIGTWPERSTSVDQPAVNTFGCRSPLFTP